MYVLDRTEWTEVVCTASK